jgi:hypothetical protein
LGAFAGFVADGIGYLSYQEVGSRELKRTEERKRRREERRTKKGEEEKWRKE